MNEDRPAAATSDSPCPLAFVVLAAFASALVWLCTLVLNLPLR
jgi:hypothetical protein